MILEKYLPLRNKVKEILSTNNYQLNSKKTMFKSNHLNVTLINIIDDRMTINNKYKRRINQELYYINKFGFIDHVENKFKKYTKDSYTYLEELSWRIVYIKQIEPKIGNKRKNDLLNILSEQDVLF